MTYRPIPANYKIKPRRAAMAEAINRLVITVQNVEMWEATRVHGFTYDVCVNEMQLARERVIALLAQL